MEYVGVITRLLTIYQLSGTSKKGWVGWCYFGGKGDGKGKWEM